MNLLQQHQLEQDLGSNRSNNISVISNWMIIYFKKEQLTHTYLVLLRTLWIMKITWKV